jgi:hypothetical protein
MANSHGDGIVEQTHDGVDRLLLLSSDSYRKAGRLVFPPFSPTSKPHRRGV